MSRFATFAASQPAIRLYRLLIRLLPNLRSDKRGAVGGARPARLDLALLSDHELRDLGYPPRIYRDGWLAAPWVPLSDSRPRHDRLPPI